MADTQVEDKQVEEETELLYRTNESPALSTAFLMGFQHIMVCLSGMLVIAYLVSDFVCAADEEKIALRARLISSILIVSGLVTILQTTFGLRLSILQGPAFAYIPPLLSFSRLPDMQCANPEIDYIQRLQIIAGSVFAAGLVQSITGFGLIGIVSRRVGPLTIVPLMILLCIGNCTIVLEKAALHWISIVQFSFLLIFIFFMADLQVPFPVLKDKKLKIVKINFFGQFPYLIAISLTWLLALILTKNDLIPIGNPARVDNPNSINVLKNTPWVQVSYPGQFGVPRFSLGLFLGLLTSCVASSVESLGAYKTLARVTQEDSPSSSSINRATLIQGFGCAIFGIFGCGVGATAYSENIAILSITKTASRFVFQIAGGILIVMGFFTKFTALLGTIPDPMIGGIFGMSVSLVCGICLSNLSSVNLKNSRNLSILGLAIILGILIPNYIELYPISSGIKLLDQTLNILLTTRMFLGGAIAFVLDIVTGGPLTETTEDDARVVHEHFDGYSFPLAVNRWLLSNNKLFKYLPFMPTKKELNASVRKQETKRTGPESHSLIVA